MTSKTLFLESVVSQVPRLLSLMDRNKTSRTHGCFDRQYWHYRTVDFPCGRYQEAVLTLALLYKIKSKNNPYYHDEKIKEYINAGVKFWCRSQKKNGTFDEWYPNEYSFVTTAFTTYAISEAVLEVPEIIKNKKIVINHLKRSADWLSRNDEKRVFNQQSGAAVALYNVYLLTIEKKYFFAAKKKIKTIVEHQLPEGWWYEYEGPDTGYLSLMIDYLSKYYSKSKDEKLLPTIKKAVSFLQYFVHPDGTSGGDYSSRNTEYLIPSGFFILGDKSKEANAIKDKIASNLESEVGIGPRTLDDRYLAYIGYNWLQAHTHYSKSTGEILPCDSDNLNKFFTNAQIWIRGSSDYYLIVNGKKGGAFCLTIKNNNRKFIETGIVQELSSGFLSNGRIDHANNCLQFNNEMLVNSSFFPVKSDVMNTTKSVVLRIFQKTFGQVEVISIFIKKILRDMLISKKSRSKLKSHREIIFNDEIIIKDLIELDGNTKKVLFGEKFSEIYIPSAEYFQKGELENKEFKVFVDGKKDNLSIIRTISKKGGLKFTHSFEENK